MRPRLAIALCVVFALLALLTTGKAVSAQSDEALSLRLRRDFGYGSGTGDIQGRFSLIAEGPEELSSVTFYIDGEEMGTISEQPFRWRFETDDYPLGVHTMTAVGLTTGGQQLESPGITRNFVPAGEGLETVGRIIGLVVVVLALLFGGVSLVLWLVTRNRPPLPLGAQRSYGHYGGTICPACQRPYSMHIYGLNLLTRRLDRCPHCGKWRLVARKSPSELEAAERAELGQAETEPEVHKLSDEEKLRRRLEESRFDDV